MSLIPQNHIFLLRPSFQNIKNPAQLSLLALRVHVRPHVRAVYLRRLGYHAQLLVRVLLDVSGGAGPDEVEFQVLLWVGCFGGCWVVVVAV